MKSFRIISFVLLTLSIFAACSRATVPRIINTKPLESNELTADSITTELNNWQLTFESSANGYYVRTQSYIPPLNDHFFLILNGDKARFKAFEQNIKTRSYSVIEATYELDLWNTIDSLVNRFWTKPEEIPITIGVSDGGETEMIGRKNGNYHRVFSTNASIQDPQFDSLANIISQQLYWNTLLEHLNGQNGR